MSLTEDQKERREMGKDLAESGDLDLVKYRSMFEIKHQRSCKLTDDELIDVCMAPDDDQDDDQWIADMLTAETKIYGVHTS